VLHRFHRERGDDAAALQAAADAELAALGLDAAAMLPYRASFESFAPAYLAWWAERASAGWSWDQGETEHEVHPPALAPTGLHGRLDRLDTRGDTRCVLDYKTGGADRFKRSVKRPLEDTQLVFYAALLADATPGPVEAAYLTLDEPAAPQLIAHPGVQNSAVAMLEGLGGELRRLRAGAALPALGEGQACELCEVRGLCRRDQWGPA
jgi:ATP-dependent helicase/nuclease subunit B